MFHPETIVSTPLGMYEALKPSRKCTGVHLRSLSGGVDSVEWSAPIRTADPSPMFKVMTAAGYSVTVGADDLIVTYEAKATPTPLNECVGKNAALFIGFGETSGLPTPSHDMATRAGMTDYLQAPLPVMVGDASVRLSWIRGVVEGFAFIDSAALHLPYSETLQIILLSVGIPSLKMGESLRIPSYWMQDFCQFIQPSALKLELMRILNNTTHIPDVTPHGNRRDLLVHRDNYYKHFAKAIFLTPITSVEEVSPEYGYTWKTSPSTAIVANGMLVQTP